MGSDLPSGTVTFLFTDVEGSTRLLHALGAEGYADALAEHRRLLREAFTRHGGVEVDTQGDAFFIAFPTAPGALAAATEATQALTTGPIRVRIGLHTGTPHLTDEGYVGADVHRAARIAAAGHGGQILVSAATATLVDASGLRDLGLHRLKDLTAAERIFQADPAAHPPLQTLHQTNLPVPATPFLGREAEVVEIGSLLARDEVRLVTLTGPGGTGKTRLALQAAAGAAEAFAGGVWWVPLAALRDPALVIESAAQSLGASGGLAEHIGDTRLLLLLDNFEHLTSAAADMAPLLAMCPNLTLLITSREPLHLVGEHEYAVDPLAPAEAVELFLTRAIAAKRDFVPSGEVAQICARLDHLPLAIELAAARVKVLSPAALLERLDQRLPLLAGGSRDAPERQRTLRATIEWSHELLTPDEQRLFARLAVFRGGCTLEAAEAVAGADLDTVTSLVDKSLVRVRDTGRFWMLETIREFATEKLAASGEAAVLNRRHAEFFLALVEKLEPDVLHDDQRTLDRLEDDHDNLRAALDELERIDPHRQARLAGALSRFWYQKGHFPEGLRRLDRGSAPVDVAPEIRAKLLVGSARLLISLGRIGEARARAERALEIQRSVGNRWGEAYAQLVLATAYGEAHDMTRDLVMASQQLEECLALFKALDDEPFALIAGYNLAWIALERGDRDRAKVLLERSLAEARRLGHRGVEAESLAQLGLIARDDGGLVEAAGLLRDAVRLDADRGMVFRAATQLARLASVLVRLGDARRAATLIGVEQAIAGQLGADLPSWTVERNEETLGLARAQRPATEVDDALAAGHAMSLADAVALALDQ